MKVLCSEIIYRGKPHHCPHPAKYEVRWIFDQWRPVCGVHARNWTGPLRSLEVR